MIRLSLVCWTMQFQRYSKEQITKYKKNLNFTKFTPCTLEQSVKMETHFIRIQWFKWNTLAYLWGVSLKRFPLFPLVFVQSCFENIRWQPRSILILIPFSKLYSELCWKQFQIKLFTLDKNLRIMLQYIQFIH